MSLSWPRKLGNHQSLRRDYSPYQAGRFGKVHSAGRRRREDSAETSLADRCLPAELAPVAVTLCGRKTRAPLESDAFRLTGITRAGMLRGWSPGRQSDTSLYRKVRLPGRYPAPTTFQTRSEEHTSELQ